VSVEAYPLTWPTGWKRTLPISRTRAKFSTGRSGYDSEKNWVEKSALTIAQATERVLGEMRTMHIDTTKVIISTNLQLRSDGLPRSGQKAPADPGVSVYWNARGQKNQRCIAIDRYDRVQDNLAAIAATLYAMRAIERHGGAEILDRAFTGFIALAAPEQPFQVLGVSSHATRDEIETAYRRLASENHPDRGGDADRMARINAARDAMMQL
jgi:hypothetical protein